MEKVQVKDAEAFGSVMQLTMSAMMKAVQHRGMKPEAAADALDGFAQEDGSLHVYSKFDGEMVAVEAGKWSVLSAVEMADARIEAIRNMQVLAKDGTTEEDLVESLVKQIGQATAQHHVDRSLFALAAMASDQVIVVIDRAHRSMQWLDSALKNDLSALAQKADAWVAGTDAFALVSHGRDPAARWLVGVPSREWLLGQALEQAADVVDEVASCLMVAGTVQDRELQQALEKRWFELGGRTGTPEGATRETAEAKGEPMAQAFVDRIVEGTALVVDGSEQGREALADLFKVLGMSEEQIESHWKTWLKSGGKYLVYTGNEERPVVMVDDAEELEDVASEMVARMVQRATSMHIGRAVAEESLKEVKDAISRGSERALNGGGSRRGQALASWANQGYEGLHVEARHGQGGDVLLVKLDGQCIEECNTRGLVALLHKMVADGPSLMASRGTLAMYTSAFDDDHRGLEDIPQMQAFISAVVKECPWWLHALLVQEDGMDSLRWWVLAMTDRLAPTEYMADGRSRAHVDTRSMQNVMMDGLRACARLYDDAVRKGWVTEAQGGRLMESVGQGVMRLRQQMQ